MKKAASILCISGLIASSAVLAEPEAGDREIILAGSGGSSSGFDSTALGVGGQYGMFQTKEFEWGIRQNINFTDTDGGHSQLNGATRVFADYHFSNGDWQPYVGGSLGAQYGAGVKDAFIIGPEIGLKYYVLPKTFVVGQASYQFAVDQDADDGSLFYTLGMGYNF